MDDMTWNRINEMYPSRDGFGAGKIEIERIPAPALKTLKTAPKPQDKRLGLRRLKKNNSGSGSDLRQRR